MKLKYFGAPTIGFAVIILVLGIAAAQTTKRTPTERKPQPPPPNSSIRLLFVDADGTHSAIRTSTPGSTDLRELLTVSHADGYPIKARLDPTGTYVAYTLLPMGNQPAFAGTVWLARIDGQSAPQLVDRNIDYGWAPQWAPDGHAFVYVKKQLLPSSGDQYQNRLFASDLSGKTENVFLDSTSLELIPIGWASDNNSVYVSRVFPDGDAIYRIELRTGAPTLLRRLSGDAATNLALSPNGDAIVGNMPVDARNHTYRGFLVSTNEGRLEYVAAGLLQAPFHAVWGTDGQTLITTPSDSIIRYSRVQQSNTRTSGIQERRMIISSAKPVVRVEPLALSPDGIWLAMRLYHPSGESVAVWNQDTGFFWEVSGHWVDFVGWLGH